MIKINVNGKELASFKNRMPQYQDLFFLRLQEIDINTTTGTVSPIYQPLFRIERQPRQIGFSVFIGGFEHALIFRAADPYVSYEKYESVKEKRNGI